MVDVLVACSSVGVLLAGTILSVRVVLQHRLEATARTFALSFPRGVEQTAVQALMRSLVGLLAPRYQRPFRLVGVAFEVWADATGIRHQVRIPARAADYLVTQLRAAIPGVRITPLDDSDGRHGPLTRAIELRLTSSTKPLRVADPASVAAALLASLQPLGQGETAVMQWMVTPAVPREVMPTSQQPATPRSWWTAALFALWTTPSTRPRGSGPGQDKFAQPTFLAVGRLAVGATSLGRARHLLRRLIAVMHIVRMPGVTFERRRVSHRTAAGRLQRAAMPLLAFPCLLNAAELTALVAFPIGSPVLPGLSLAGAAQLPPAADIPTQGRVLARASFPGAERPLALSPADSLRHIHVIGPTGVGKSTLLLNLITQDMAAGDGVAVIDPKGDLIADVLDRVPRHRVSDVILLDPTDSERPVGLNLLAGATEAPGAVTDQVVGIFHKLYTSFWGPCTDDILRAALLTLVQEPGMTLCEVPLLLTDESFRRRLVGRVDDPVALGPFWAWYDGLSIGERAQAIGPVMNKLRAFLLRRRLRNVIGQAEPTFDMRQVLDQGNILLVSLTKGLLGDEAAALLGSLVVARLWQAVQARAELAQEERRPFFCHVDEFQDYLNLPTSLADVLAQARGFGLGLTLAHQHLSQLPAQLRQAVLANARTKVVFQTSAEDARLLAREFAPYLAAPNLQVLGPYEVIVSASAGSRVAPPASAVTLPRPPSTDMAALVRLASRRRYGVDQEAIEQAIRARHEPPPGTGPVGRRRRP